MSNTDRIDFLEKKIRRLKWANDDLRSKLFDANQRAAHIARDSCCHDTVGSLQGEIQTAQDEIKQLREALRESEERQALLYRQFNAKGNHPPGPRCVASAKSLRHEKRVSAFDKENNPPSPTSAHNSGQLFSGVGSSASQVALLQAQLANLQERYDHLEEVKVKAARRYSADYRKWKEFKKWLANSDNGKGISRRRLEETHRKTKSSQPNSDKKRSISVQHSETEDDSQAPSVPNTSCFTRNDTVPQAQSGNGPLSTACIEHARAEGVPKGKRPLEHYMEFKGRGRYKKNLHDDSQTINAQFQIDPILNNGLNFQYDAVVRNKEERKRLHASDCECCKDYYEAIGPLPPRLQPPLWRTPPSSPARSTEDRTINSIFAQEQDIANHRKAISRHRHNWAVPVTPPKYWSIGFPTTQEVLDINVRAEEMNLSKRRAAEVESSTGAGRYKRR